jgi:hypothetical protein
MRAAWLLVVLLLAVPPTAACSWGGLVEGRWGIWDTATGELEVIRTQMFSHGTACEPYPPGHVLAGDWFVWPEASRATNTTVVHARHGDETVSWAIHHRGAMRAVEHMGLAGGIAYFVWDERGTDGYALGRLDIADGSYADLPNPYPDASPYWMGLSGSVLWIATGATDGAAGYDLAVGREVLRIGTSDLGVAPGDAWVPPYGVAHGWVLFADNHDGPGTFRAWNASTGRVVEFPMAWDPHETRVGGQYVFLLGDDGLHRVDLAAEPPTTVRIDVPSRAGVEFPPGQFGQWLGVADGSRLVLAWFEAPDGPEGETTSGKPAGLSVLAIVAALGLAAAGRRRLANSP